MEREAMWPHFASFFFYVLLLFVQKKIISKSMNDFHIVSNICFASRTDLKYCSFLVARYKSERD